MSNLKENTRCKLFYCDRVKDSRCCASCSYRTRCTNPCINKPEKCGQMLTMEVSNETKHP